MFTVLVKNRMPRCVKASMHLESKSLKYYFCVMFFFLKIQQNYLAGVIDYICCRFNMSLFTETLCGYDGHFLV
jgi:hypothetical protein